MPLLVAFDRGINQKSDDVVLLRNSVERFHISAFLIFVLAQNMREAEGPWFHSFLSNAFLVFVCEMMIDIIKHSFIAKFNDIKPIAFSEFLEDLCNQTLNIETENGRKNLTFVPLAPACVMGGFPTKILTTGSIHIQSNSSFDSSICCSSSYGPLPWRLFWILLLSMMTFVMLASLKVMVGIGLKKYAKWYIKRCQKRKLHSD
ncbi:unnamed protein product [Thlaspi arvense]|uniref:Uncharacterized protein n=1 Tax=Thlaspi arvense TaxID=13288 RepID=A0AAU9RSJ8_THLAR|nr:unnamed protein product [Thlaspi arvense]